jgi:hypothetical protein
VQLLLALQLEVNVIHKYTEVQRTFVESSKGRVFVVLSLTLEWRLPSSAPDGHANLFKGRKCWGRCCASSSGCGSRILRQFIYLSVYRRVVYGAGNGGPCSSEPLPLFCDKTKAYRSCMLGTQQ